MNQISDIPQDVVVATLKRIRLDGDVTLYDTILEILSSESEYFYGYDDDVIMREFATLYLIASMLYKEIDNHSPDKHSRMNKWSSGLDQVDFPLILALALSDFPSLDVLDLKLCCEYDAIYNVISGSAPMPLSAYYTLSKPLPSTAIFSLSDSEVYNVSIVVVLMMQYVNLSYCANNRTNKRAMVSVDAIAALVGNPITTHTGSGNVPQFPITRHDRNSRAKIINYLELVATNVIPVSAVLGNIQSHAVFILDCLFEEQDEIARRSKSKENINSEKVSENDNIEVFYTELSSVDDSYL